MARTIVGILRGGASNEYNLSLKTGSVILDALSADKYETKDILIDKRGYWHLRGIPTTPARALAQVDVVLNGLHGGPGEDGTVQRILDRTGVPYAGSRAQGAGLSLNKINARRIFVRAGIRMPRAVSFALDNGLTTAEMAQSVFSQFSPPYIVKPPSEGASHGLRIAQTIAELPELIGDVLDKFGAVLIEEFLVGELVSVGLIENFRDQELFALPPAHVRIPDGARFLEKDHHESGAVEYEVPSNFTHAEKRAIEELAKRAHRALKLAHFSRADIILTKYGPFILEINALPGLYPGSSFAPMLEAVGSSVAQFLDHAIALSRR